MNSHYKRCLVKISGAALGGQGAIYDQRKLVLVAKQLVKLAQEGVELAVIVGGGNIWRGTDAEKIGGNKVTADYMGMLATIMNGLAMEACIKKMGYQDVIVCSAIAVNKVTEPYYYKRVLSKLQKKFIVIMPAGLGHPFFTTDTAAVLRAAETQCDIILMAKNKISGVYTADPHNDKCAQRIAQLNVSEVIADKLKFMDGTASTLALARKIDILVFDIDQKNSIYDVAHGRGKFSLVKSE